jgi:dihydrofolate reductase
MVISLISAVGPNKEIGFEGHLPWNLPSDLQHFKQLTTGHTIIMGRKTYESIGRPLPNRTNVVITRNPDFKAPGCLTATSIDESLKVVPPDETEVFIIGGAALYAEGLAHCGRIYLTQVENYSGPADAFFPDVDFSKWEEISRETPPQTEKDDYPFSFIVYKRLHTS